MTLARHRSRLAWLAYLAVLGCAPDAAPGPVVVGTESNGRRVRVAEGGTLLVRLPSNGTTGYRWTASRVPGQLKLVRDEYEAPQQSGPQVAGAGGVQELRFAASSEGRGTLVLAYRPGWDESGVPAETFSVTAEVVRK